LWRIRDEKNRQILRVATFNLQNLRLRTREGRPVLDGAVDQDRPDVPLSIEIDLADREKTATVVSMVQADVVALQEVFDLAALDYFHDTFLVRTGSPEYPFRYCLPGNDGRGLNVAALSRRRAVSAKSHAELTGADLGLSDLPHDLRNQKLFRRDCLELDFENVTLFICHFKAPYPDPEKALLVRKAEAQAVRKIVDARFPQPENERWMILGDFNEPARGTPPSRSTLAPLKRGFSIDLLDRLSPGTNWTYEVLATHVRSRPDRILVSPRLAQEYPEVRPQIVRSGMISSLRGCLDEPAPGEAPHRPHASDHALVYADFPGL